MSLELPDQDLAPGVLPTEIRKLVQSRRQVKQMMKEPNVSPDLMMQVYIVLVCPLVSNIAQKVMNGLQWNFMESSWMVKGRTN